VTLYTSGSLRSDTLVIAHYPVAGNDRNTGPRYQAEARITGFDILGVTRVGADTLRPSWRLRKELSIERFDAACEDYATYFRSYCADYEYVIMRGQSTGAFPTLGIIKSGRLPVTHILIEDGVNTRRSRRGEPRGAIAARIDWLNSTLRERRTLRHPPHESWSLPEALPARPGAFARFCVEQFHWAPLWRSDYSRQSILQIVRTRPDLPMLIKFLGHTGTTTNSEVAELQREISQLASQRLMFDSNPADVRVDFDVDAWHGYLLYPQYGAENLRTVRSMRSATRR
jgi:hypothetical protein